MIAVGKKAPAFRAKDQDEKTVTLADLAGRWAVLFFYPKDDTSGWTTEAREFTGALREFAALDAVVVGASPDTPERHRTFIAKHGLKVRLLSDPEHTMLAAYGAWGEKTMYGRKVTGVIRSTVLVDPEGRVAHHWPKVKAAGHAEAVRETLAALRAGKGP